MERSYRDTPGLFSLGGGTVAYFSMEVALEVGMPTYSGGLGVLAGDTIRAAADLGLPMLAITMLYHKGFFRQTLSSSGRQEEEPVEWDISKKLQNSGIYAEITIEGRRVKVGAYCYVVTGAMGSRVPVYFLEI